MSETLTEYQNRLELRIERERRIAAPVQIVFEALLEELATGARNPDGESMSMRIEPFPGGRWWRDLGDGAGHLWAHVQAIKPPTLLELTGPLFMSHAVVNNVQYRLAEEDGRTVLKLVHEAFGLVPDAAREGVQHGWDNQLDRLERAVAQ